MCVERVVTHTSWTRAFWFFFSVSILLSTSQTKDTKVGTGGRNWLVQPTNWYWVTFCDIPIWREGGRGEREGRRRRREEEREGKDNDSNLVYYLLHHYKGHN